MNNQTYNTARHCPFRIAPITINRDVFQHVRKEVFLPRHAVITSCL